MEQYEKAIFAGGCFWCIEDAFHGLPGVKETVPGYTGGEKANPTYEQVCTGRTCHYEAVQVTYDPDVTSYEELLKVFFSHIDPTDPDGQFADKGPQYRTAIFYLDEKQKQKAMEAIRAIDCSRVFDKAVVTLVLPAQPFYPAEEYHQGYHLKNPERYCNYKRLSGREAFIEAVWGK